MKWTRKHEGEIIEKPVSKKLRVKESSEKTNELGNNGYFGQ
jgi:hypothetical protein